MDKMNTRAGLIDLLDGSVLEPFRYSGRFMYGASCVAVQGDSTIRVTASLLDALSRLVEDETSSASAPAAALRIKELADLMQEARQDQLGLGVVIYWPNVNWDDSLTVEEDEDT